MAAGSNEFVARHVHDLIERQRLDSLGDIDLLRQFLLSQSDDAFAALVRRHGPMVLGTCRRVLRHTQDAEDACQATFLILARKARTIRSDVIGAWLHRVAVRISLRLLNDSERRSTQKLPVELLDPNRSSDDLALKEVIAAFDEEVARMPRRFRLPLVLCCLQGLTRDETARILGWTQGAVRGRLERGRKLLQSRFLRRGLTLTAGMFAMILEQSTPSIGIASPSMATSIARSLAERVIRSMAMARMKVATCSVAAMMLIGTLAGIGFFHPIAAQPKPAGLPATTSPTPPAPVAVADAEKNLDTFVIRLSLAPQGEGKFDPKYTLYHVLLYVPNLRLEPPANGPTGKPMEAHAKITKEQAKKIVEVLNRFDFFKEDAARNDPFQSKLQLIALPNWPHAGITVRYQNGEDAVRKELMLAWLPSMLPPLDGMRQCVDGDAAKALDQLIGQLSEERKKWTSDLIADLKKMQGTWTPGSFNSDKGIGGTISDKQTMKCVIEEKRITLKPKIKLDPLMDLETIRGEFELSVVAGQRLMTIKGERDTITKIERGTWTLQYDVSDTTLTLLVPPSGKSPPADGKPRYEQGDRQFILKKAAAGVASEWGEPSHGLRTRIRTTKLKYAANESPTFEIDFTSDEGTAAKRYRGTRVDGHARLEVDGTWYITIDPAIRKKLAQFELKPGSLVESWITVIVAGDSWMPENSRDFDGVAVPLRLKPGKHKIRISHEFTVNQDDDKLTANPVSGVLEIEIEPPAPKGMPPTAASSAFGEPSDGLIARIRTEKEQYRVGETIDILYDVAGFGDAKRSWHGTIAGHYARIEVDGVWYVWKQITDEYPIRMKLTAGGVAERWTTVRLDSNWVAESTRKKEPSVELKLRPGKHTIRVAYDFSSDATKPPSGRPISGPLEINVVAAPGTQISPTLTWRESKNWKFAATRANDLAISPDGARLAITDGKELTVWDMTRSEPKEIDKANIEPMTLLGFDAKGTLLLVKHSPVHHISEFRPHPVTILEGGLFRNQPIKIVECDQDVRVAIGGQVIAYVQRRWDSVRIIGAPFTKDRILDKPIAAVSLGLPHRLVFSDDGKTLFGFGANGPIDPKEPNGAVVAWDVETGAVRWHRDGGTEHDIAVASANGSTIALGSASTGDVLVLEGATGKSRYRVVVQRLAGLSASQDGKIVAISSIEDGNPKSPKLALFDAESGKSLLETATPGSIRRIAFDPKGRGFAAIDNIGQVKWWDRVDSGR